MKSLFNYTTLKRTATLILFGIVMFACEEVDPLLVDGRTIVFKDQDIKISQDLVYGNDVGKQLMNVYESPDYDKKKPVVILTHGGNFGSPTRLNELYSLAFGLAKRGYVAAVIKLTPVNLEYGIYPTMNYSLEEISFAFTRGMMDMKAAIRYFRANETEYKIDPENIFIGGWSTGAHVSLAAAYVESESELDEMEDAGLAESYKTAIQSLGGTIEGNRGNEGFSSKVKAVVGLMPQVMDPVLIDQGEAPLLMITDRDSYGWDENGSEISLIGVINGKSNDYNWKGYGHVVISQRAKDIGLQMEEHLIVTGESKPNITPLRIKYHQTIADFLSSNWTSTPMNN